jgi:hypothetical protein
MAEFLKQYTVNALGEHRLICFATGVEQSAKMDFLPPELTNRMLPFFEKYRELTEIGEDCTLKSFEVLAKDGTEYLRMTVRKQIGRVYHECKGSRVSFEYTTPARLREYEIKQQASAQGAEFDNVKYYENQIRLFNITNELIELFQVLSDWIKDNWLRLLHVNSDQLKMFDDKGNPIAAE